LGNRSQIRYSKSKGNAQSDAKDTQRDAKKGQSVRPPKGFTFRVGVPQRWAAVLLLVFLAECCWTIGRQQVSSEDFRYARCGREMWERPSPLPGYFTTCGNLNGDGVFAYRLAGFPLTAERLAMLATDWFRKPADRLYSGANGSPLAGSNWEMRHEIGLGGVKWLMHLPFMLMAIWLGGGLWWVSRRLFGNEGGFLSLALYIFSPAVVRYSVVPNNEVLAMWGLYGVVYTGIGVAHAMQGPRRKWKPRIALLTLALGLTAAAHLLAAMVGFAAAVLLMMYLAEGRRSAVLIIMTYAALGAGLIEFALFSLRPAAFSYVFTGGAGRFWFTADGVRAYVADPANWPTLIAVTVSLMLYAGVRRSRYFGNSVPLAMYCVIAFLETTQVRSAAWFWALPFAFTFVGGVFADALETRQRKLYLTLTGMVVLTQAMACWAMLPAVAAGL
jgi:hypothetical protein